MDLECKKFAKEIRSLDKEMRSWEIYASLEAAVKNTLTSLKAVGELQNPAIRQRHWDQLMSSTKVSKNRKLDEQDPVKLWLNLANDVREDRKRRSYSG